MSSFPDVPGLREREILEPGYLADLDGVVQRTGLDRDHLAAVLSLESGHDPHAINKLSGASGLIQWMPQYAPKPLTIDQIRGMTAREQLPYVEQHFKMFGKLGARDTYPAVFWPAAIGKDDGYVLASTGSAAYTQNAGLDRDKDGNITAGDIRAVIDGRVAAAASKPRVEVGPAQPMPSSSPAGPRGVSRMLLGASVIAVSALLALGWRYLR